MERPLRAVTDRPIESEYARQTVEPSFEEFFRSTRGRLFTALVVMTGDRAEAEELLQDAFLKVWERWERVAGMDNPTGFLYRVSINLYRKRLRRAALAIRKVVDPTPAVDQFADVDMRDEAVRLLGRLTPRERAAVVVTAYLGYSGEEAGRLLGIQGSTVRVLTGRARAKLSGDEEGSA
jgi:RNA polymerase sigma-70 factor (ECF subfamily)